MKKKFNFCMGELFSPRRNAETVMWVLQRKRPFKIKVLTKFVFALVAKSTC
jgi:hypothetical protein